MSGGYFDYQQHRIEDIAESIQSLLDRQGKRIPEDELYMSKDWYKSHPKDLLYPTFSEKMQKEFREAVELLRKAAIYAQRIDWYLSGDDGEDTFHERLKEDLEDHAK